MQQDCDDCGQFAIAFATSLARGEQPGGFFYEQKVMRKHLIESLEKQNITAFPAAADAGFRRGGGGGGGTLVGGTPHTHS